jgi:hypothetical protein
MKKAWSAGCDLLLQVFSNLCRLEALVALLFSLQVCLKKAERANILLNLRSPLGLDLLHVRCRLAGLNGECVLKELDGQRDCIIQSWGCCVLHLQARRELAQLLVQ